MKHFLRRWRLVLAAIALAAGAAAPAIILQAGPAAAADDSFVVNDYTGNQVGDTGGTLQDLGNGSQQQNLYFEGQVATAAQGGPWPFDIASDDSYYDGDNVWIVYKSGTNYCWTATLEGTGGAYVGAYTNTACGLSHTYSLVVQAPAWDGDGSSHESWVDVGATDHTVNGSYLCDPSYGAGTTWATSCNATKDSFHTVVG